MKSRFFSPFLVLKFRDFRLLWMGLLISRIGSEMQIVAINWHIYQLTGSPLSLGFVGLARFLPIIFLSLIGGLIADIKDRRKLMLLAQFSMTVSSLVLAFCTFNGLINPFIIYLMIAFSSAASAFDIPARHSIVPSLVPKKYFINAVSLNSVMWQIAMVLGPSIAGFIIGFINIGSVYLLNAISFLAVIVALILMKSPKTKTKNTYSLSSIVEGINFIRRTPIIYSTMLLDFFATFFSSATILLPIFAKDILFVGPKALGFLYAAPSIGALTFGLLFSSLKQVKNQGKVLIASVSLYGLATVLFAFSRSFYLSMFLLFLTGVGDVISAIIRNTIRQLKTPDHLRGRMVSVNMIFFLGGPQLGELEAGFLAALAGAPLSVAIGGIGTIITVGILSLLIPTLRNYNGEEIIV